MKKLVLDAESLAVESFAAGPALRPRATVRAFEATADSPCELSVDLSSCGTCGEITCDRICPDSAYETCSRFCSGPTVSPDFCP